MRRSTPPNRYFVFRVVCATFYILTFFVFHVVLSKVQIKGLEPISLYYVKVTLYPIELNLQEYLTSLILPQKTPFVKGQFVFFQDSGVSYHGDRWFLAYDCFGLLYESLERGAGFEPATLSLAF